MDDLSAFDDIWSLVLQPQYLDVLTNLDRDRKRFKELESKMKDAEILENIDLNKILDELKNRDKKIASLIKVEDDFDTRINVIE